MAWYEDLAACGTDAYDNYFSVWHPSLLRAVGWLEYGKVYSQGAVDPQVVKRLTELTVDPWEPVQFLGFHCCDLCPAEQGPLGVSNLFIPGDAFLYVAPELIVHYITVHRYAPPAQFCEAVLACPPMGGTAYLQAVVPVWKRAKTK
jgi:hypothetical protein